MPPQVPTYLGTYPGTYHSLSIADRDPDSHPLVSHPPTLLSNLMHQAANIK